MRRRLLPRLSYTSCVAASLVPSFRPLVPPRSTLAAASSTPPTHHRLAVFTPRFTAPASPCCPADCPPTRLGRDPSRRRHRRRSRAAAAAANWRIAAAHPPRPPPRAAAAADPIVATPAGADAAVSGFDDVQKTQPARRTGAASGWATRKFRARTYASSRPRTARTCSGRAGAAARWRRAWTDPTSSGGTVATGGGGLSRDFSFAGTERRLAPLGTAGRPRRPRTTPQRPRRLRKTRRGPRRRLRRLDRGFGPSRTGGAARRETPSPGPSRRLPRALDPRGPPRRCTSRVVRAGRTGRRRRRRCSTAAGWRSGGTRETGDHRHGEDLLLLLLVLRAG